MTKFRLEGQLTHDILESQNADKDTRYYTLVNVNYNSDGGDHWVGVIGMETIDGTDYLKVSPTSENDSVVGKESPRGKQGWRESSTGDGTILVPVSQTKGYVNFTQEINNEN